MDPFRNELAAAHEKIARLENQIAVLRGLPPPHAEHLSSYGLRTNRPSLRSSSSLLFLLGGLALTGTLTVAGVIIIVRQSSHRPSRPLSELAVSVAEMHESDAALQAQMNRRHHRRPPAPTPPSASAFAAPTSAPVADHELTDILSL